MKIVAEEQSLMWTRDQDVPFALQDKIEELGGIYRKAPRSGGVSYDQFAFALRASKLMNHFGIRQTLRSPES
jgi:hypothetical protein